MPRKDPVSLRLSAVFEMFAGGPSTDVHATVVDKNGKASGVMTFAEWKDIPDLAKAKAFQTLINVPLLSQMNAAFEAAGLDSTYPMHWYTLVALFSWAHFGDHRRRGAPIKWDSVKYCKLLKDFAKKKEGNPALSDEDVFKLLAKSGSYESTRGPLTTNRLRKLFKEANDPDKNQLLGLLRVKD
jgi:hypothetical protein